MFLIFKPFIPLYVLTNKVAVIKSHNGTLVKHSIDTWTPALPIHHYFRIVLFQISANETYNAKTFVESTFYCIFFYI